MNPYLDAVDGHVRRPDVPAPRDVDADLLDRLDAAMRLRWGVRGAKSTGLVHVFAWAIPNDAALDAVAAEAPILEVCAGTGYWARLLRDRGVDVVATDRLEHDAHWNGITWTDVEAADAEDAARRYTRTGDPRRPRTLLLVWPPMSDAAARALAEFEAQGGETVVYVGEGPGGCTADDDFHATLAHRWTLDAEVAIPQYEGLRDRLHVFRRLNPGRPLGLDPNRLRGT